MAGVKCEVFVFTLTLIVTIVFAISNNINQCPCETEALCSPVNVQYEKEIYAFCNSADRNTWEKFAWDKVTTIALDGFYDEQLMCLAHKNNVRVVNTVNIAVEKLPDPETRKSWIADQLSDVQAKFLDGINIDLESEIAKDSPERDGLTNLVREAKATFQEAIPSSQVTFDIAWSPDGIDGRFYDAVGIAEAADFLFVMSYDEQSQIKDGECTARANSGYNKTTSGIMEFLELGIPAEKLVLGIPWYGYNYPCLNMSTDNVCYIPIVPFRGVNCSDAAGRQYAYPDILKYLENSTTGRIWDNNTLSPYFNYKDGDTYHQVWYDDPESLTYKYNFAVNKGLKGVGMWNIVFLDFSDTEEAAKLRQGMWDALPIYRRNVIMSNEV